MAQMAEPFFPGRLGLVHHRSRDQIVATISSGVLAKVMGLSKLVDDPEDSYGTRKRFRFIEAAIAGRRPQHILDVGCGVGRVSLELAQRFPDIQITGIDSDRASIDHARRAGPPANLHFLHVSELEPQETFDLIIASEVLEHVDQPEEFLLSLRRQLTSNNRLILTVPNGYGPFEIMSLIHGMLQITGIHRLFRLLRRGRRSAQTSSDSSLATLANSPHINFFSFQALNRLIASAGFEVRVYQPRTFLCGFLLDTCLRGRRIIDWNASIADSLPAALSSDWMFLLEPGIFQNAGRTNKTPGLYGKFHRYVNKRCSEMAAAR
jgi:2-polyprenyl-3-methyl-5-hydroxy-6-metoxy-1,4-benzoquinol methylase